MFLLFCLLFRRKGREKRMDTLWHIFHAGGWMMGPILLCSFLAAAIGVERFLFYRGSRSRMEVLADAAAGFGKTGDAAVLAAVLEEEDGCAARVLRKALAGGGSRAAQSLRLECEASRELTALRRYLPVLRAIVTMAPLLGLLGTVIGMIQSFRVLTAAAGQPAAVTGGVAEALICTAFGLFAAILALLLHSFFSQRLDELTAQMEQAANLYLAALAERES